jgi:hypothetical protein
MMRPISIFFGQDRGNFNAAKRLRVLRSVDDTHRAAAQLLGAALVRDGPSDHGLRILVRPNKSLVATRLSGCEAGRGCVTQPARCGFSSAMTAVE